MTTLIPPVIALLAGALLLPALAVAAPRVPLATAVPQAEAVLRVQVDDPATDQQEFADTGTPAFVRLRWRLRVLEVLSGPKDLRPGALLRVDEHAWRADLAEHRRCQGGPDCRWPDKPALDTTLSRPPRPGAQVLTLLRLTADGWQLAVDLGFDAADRVQEARKHLPKRPAEARPGRRGGR